MRPRLGIAVKLSKKKKKKRVSIGIRETLISKFSERLSVVLIDFFSKKKIDHMAQ